MNDIGWSILAGLAGTFIVIPLLAWWFARCGGYVAMNGGYDPPKSKTLMAMVERNKNRCFKIMLYCVAAWMIFWNTYPLWTR